MAARFDFCHRLDSGLSVGAEMERRGSGSSISASSGDASCSTCLLLCQGKNQLCCRTPVWVNVGGFLWYADPLDVCSLMGFFSSENTELSAHRIYATE